MKQVVVISGKGGTGKTTLTASLAALAKPSVLADCDVDAPDLHLILKPQVRQRGDYQGGEVAVIDQDLCTDCGLCREVCRFDAISEDYVVDPFACEGCGLCPRVCPVDAIEMVQERAGEWYISDTMYGPMVHAKLDVAQENSGKLVTVVRNFAKRVAQEKGLDCVVIDGPPGVGCPVISSITGVDLAIVVSEPTVSGIHDLERAVQIAGQFRVPVWVVVNKYDLNLEMTAEIERYCKENSLPLAAKLPFDERVIDALVNEKPVVEFSDGPVTQEIRRLWSGLENFCRS